MEYFYLMKNRVKSKEKVMSTSYSFGKKFLVKQAYFELIPSHL